MTTDLIDAGDVLTDRDVVDAEAVDKPSIVLRSMHANVQVQTHKFIN